MRWSIGDGGDVRVVIDPIDGSLNARRHLPSFSLSFAVASGPSMADVEFGYVYDFGAGEEFFARRGGGAFLDGEPLSHPPQRAGASSSSGWSRPSPSWRCRCSRRSPATSTGCA